MTELRNISNFYYNTNGIYKAVCNYSAFMYRYDWYVVPEVYDTEVAQEKIIGDFSRILNYLDNSYIKKLCGDIARDVIVQGAYYACVIENKDCVVFR